MSKKKKPRLGTGTGWTGSSLAEYGQSSRRGGGEEQKASAELNYSIILDQEKHLSVQERQVQVVLFCTCCN